LDTVFLIILLADCNELIVDETCRQPHYSTKINAADTIVTIYSTRDLLGQVRLMSYSV
jgi:hypothetical protein